jgi:hypothetical protein
LTPAEHSKAKEDGSMVHTLNEIVREITLTVIPSAKATKGSPLKTTRKLSRQRRAPEDRIAALMRIALGIAGFMLAIVSPTIVSPATLEEVAHCRAIPQLGERLNCFKTLKPGPRAKMEGATSAKKQDAGSSEMKDTARARAKRAAPAKTDETTLAKTQQAAPAKTDEAPPAETEQVIPAPANRDEAVPATAEQVTPAKTEVSTKSNTGEALFSPTPDDPATTSSIDRLSVAGLPLCVDADAVAAMILAGLLTSDQTKAATHGCQILPGDAKLEPLERYPSVFPSIRIVRVRVTSPTQPDLKFGFTIETAR